MPLDLKAKRVYNGEHAVDNRGRGSAIGLEVTPVLAVKE
jgi:hypothetical protein